MYRILHTHRWAIGAYSVVPYRHADIQLIRQWRNEQMDVLRQQRALTEADQERYYRTVVEPEFHSERPGQILVSYLHDNSCVGYGGLTNIQWDHRRAELSFLAATELARNSEQYQELFSNFLALIKQLAFEGAELNRLFTETFDIRPLHISILERCGFAYEGRMKQHVRIDGRFVDSLIHGCLRGDSVQR